MGNNSISNSPLLPADIVLAPAWWNHNEGITFDHDFFFHPQKRVEAERQMEKVLYDRFGKYGLGEDRDKELPVLGAVHLAAGYLLSEMLGCQVEYLEHGPPQVITAHMDELDLSVEEAFESPAYIKFERMVDALETKYGYVTGDVNWGGILNLALDLRGEDFFLDLYDRPEPVQNFLAKIKEVIDKFTGYVREKTGATSVSVNRNVRHITPPVFLHSECSLTMISSEHYEQFLFDYDRSWNENHRPFGIHFCGTDPHRYGPVFAKLPHLDFLDVGWGGDVARLREYLPDTFLNIRLSPVDIIHMTVADIEETIRRLVIESKKPELTGVCCINMDEKVSDEKICAIFETAAALREEYGKEVG